MKIYTKTGDQGKTSLLGGKRVEKSHWRLEAYGTVDELNSVVGIARAKLVILSSRENLSEYAKEMDGWLSHLQHQLFSLGSQLACEDEKIRKTLPPVTEEMVTEMERLMDKCEEVLPKLTQFILPGGSQVAGFMHLARCVCRRAERATLSSPKDSDVDPLAIKYLNRLSDLFFMLARYANFREGFNDVTWQK